MSKYILFQLLGIYLLLIAPIGVALIWRKLSTVASVKILLGRIALAVGLVITTAYGLLIAIGATCDGSIAASGYRDCTLLSDTASNAYTSIFLMLLLALIVIGSGIFVICGVREIRAYKGRPA